MTADNRTDAEKAAAKVDSDLRKKAIADIAKKRRMSVADVEKQIEAEARAKVKADKAEETTLTNG